MPDVGQTLGRYEILAKLGEGGMGVVYKARDARLNRLVALKLMLGAATDPDHQFRRFAQEAKAASALNHPNIITVYDIASEEETLYIAMEYVAGKTLGQVIPRQGMRIAEALKIAVQLADALSAAGSAGIVHRDLKPSNIMVTENGLVKVLDFGLAKFAVAGLEGGAQASTLALTVSEQIVTRNGMVAGTAAYMSPEQAEGLPLDARSDIFSFGAVLYEMVTGQRAFQGNSRMSVLTSILRDDPEPLGEKVANVPHQLETIVNRCLRKDPARRFQSFTEARLALLELQEESESGRLRSPRSRPSSGLVRHRVAPVLAVTAVVALVLAGLFYWRNGRTQRPILELRIAPFASYAGFQGFPAFSADGNQIAFAWTGGEGKVTHIFSKVIGTDAALPLTAGNYSDSLPAFAPDGRSVAFLRSLPQGVTGIYQVSPLGGHERLIAQIPTAFYPALSWSSDSRWLVTSGRSEREGRSRIYVVAASDGHYRTLSFGETGDEIYPALSKDSKMLAFSRAESDTEWGIFVAPVDENLNPTASPRRMHTPTGLNRETTWTVDRQGLVFVNGGSATSRLWRVPVSGDAEAKQLVLTGGVEFGPAIAPVGDRLAFTRNNISANIWSFPVLGPGSVGPAKQIFVSARSSYLRPHAFSADGTKIAFESDRSGAYGIWTANADGSDPALLYGRKEFISGSPAWSSDGRFVAFDTRSGKHTQIFVIAANGGPVRELTSDQYDSMLPSWSRDGKWIYFDSNRNGGRLEIYKCSPEGGEAVQVTHGGGWDAHESPDGAWLYFTRSRSAVAPLLRMPISGGQEAEVLPSIHQRWWAVAANGIWFLKRVGAETEVGILPMENVASEEAVLQFYDQAKRKVLTAAALTKSPDGGLALSPDGHSLLYSQDDYRAYEIEVAENFR
jgi:serine/threonine protein kinase/Tol biopolymer transport system component